MRFTSIWGKKWADNFIEDGLIAVAYQDWAEGLRGLNAEDIKFGISYCRDNLEWPPSIAEFRKSCLKNRKIPSSKQLVDDIIRRNFKSNLHEIVFKKIGSWNFSHDTEKDLINKVESILKECST